MTSQLERDYIDLLHPEKDPIKAFSVNVAELLSNFLESFRSGNAPVNFTSAAILLQAGSSIYGRKVEFLYNLASTLHDYLLMKPKGDPNKSKDTKEKAAKKNKIYDPSCSIDIKPGKNLSCLRKKNNVKKPTASKKPPKKTPYKVHSFVPVDLLPLEGEEKGDVFYDTKGEPVGNKGDYTLNKCRVTTSGWLLLPTVSPELILDVCNTTDYIPEMAEGDTSTDADMPCDTPCDEGYPASSGCPSSPPTAPSSQVPCSQETDEGLGSLQSTPCEGGSFPVEEVEGVGTDTPMEGVMETDVSDPASVGDENIPLDVLPATTEEDLGARPVRRSMRQALRVRQLNPQEVASEINTTPREEFVALKKAIQKKNTCNLPSKLRNVNDENSSLHPASVFCARTFFSLDSKFQKSDLLSLKVTAFANNSKFINQINKYKDAIKAAKCKRKASGDMEPDEEEEIEVEGCEELKEADVDGEPANPGLDYDDFEINKSPTHSIGGEDPPIADEIPMGDGPSMDGEAPQVDEIEAEPVVDLEAEFQRLAEEQMSRFRGDLQNFEQTSEVNERVRVWQKDLVPFLSEISAREKFDINLYGSRILNAFGDSNRRQTIIFREFCKGMEKWEVHRYFMALLPLANIGNVSLANEPREDDEDEEDILITLLSRKMHHLELEEFGHNIGEHS